MQSYKIPELRDILGPVVLLALGAILTVAIILGIKYMVGTDSESSIGRSPAGNTVFKADDSRPPGYNPAAAAAPVPGNSLDIFEKASSGYEKENSTVAAGASGLPLKTGIKPGRPAQKAEKRAKQPTVIPRMQSFKNFGSITPSGQAAPGAATPDVSTLLKQMQQHGNGN